MKKTLLILICMAVSGVALAQCGPKGEACSPCGTDVWCCGAYAPNTGSKTSFTGTCAAGLFKEYSGVGRFYDNCTIVGTKKMGEAPFAHQITCKRGDDTYTLNCTQDTTGYFSYAHFYDKTLGKTDTHDFICINYAESTNNIANLVTSNKNSGNTLEMIDLNTNTSLIEKIKRVKLALESQ